MAQHEHNGRRNYAILLLIATYGLRSCEVRALRLDRIDWSHDEITIFAPKTGRSRRLPLTRPVGEAVLNYLREERPPSVHKEVFLSKRPPHGPLRSKINRWLGQQLDKAGIETSRRGAHILRHSLAVHLLRNGETLKAIGDVLGHQVRTRPSSTPSSMSMISGRWLWNRRWCYDPTHFSGPLATEFAAFAATLEASASANKATLTLLRALDRLTKERELPSGTIDEVFAKHWLAPCESRGPNTRVARYHMLRRFCRFLAKRRPETFIPGELLRPRRRPSASPHLYSREEIRRLLDGALSLRDWETWHPCPIRSKTMHAIILLLATSGLRISEAVHLTIKDVDLKAGVLSIRQSKFWKSRLVPLSAGTLEVLRHYHDLRVVVVPAEPSEAFFVSGRGKAYSTGCVQGMFRNVAIQVGLRESKDAVPACRTCAPPLP